MSWRVFAHDDKKLGLNRNSQVEHPSHYTQGQVECIDAIESALGRDQFIGFLRGQVIKYTWRLGSKGPSDIDAGKAAWYLRRLENLLNE